jgi:hypothetical protein
MTFVPFDLGEMESVALASVRESLEAYLNKDMTLVEEACLREPQQDALYRERPGRPRAEDEAGAAAYPLSFALVLGDEIPGEGSAITR